LNILSLFILAFAVSIDGLGVGITYGLRGIRFPWWSLLIVTILTAMMILMSMGLGSLLVRVLSPAGAKIAGACLLIAIGSWAIWNLSAQKREADLEGKNPQEGLLPKTAAPKTKVFRFELEKFGLVIQILKKPTVADIDHSGSISAGEAFLLGLALSMDAFGAGIGASLIGYPAIVTAACVSLMSLTFIGIGLKVGHKYAETALFRRLAFLPGLILIGIGLAKMFT
jgi:putative sporulation protein YtaF